jgi:hypothetical protein
MSTVLTGTVAIEYMRITMTYHGLELERKTGLFMTRGIKASYVAKDDLARVGVLYRNKPITRKTRIPLETLINMYGAFKFAYEESNKENLEKNIVNT